MFFLYRHLLPITFTTCSIFFHNLTRSCPPLAIPFTNVWEMKEILISRLPFWAHTNCIPGITLWYYDRKLKTCTHKRKTLGQGFNRKIIILSVVHVFVYSKFHCAVSSFEIDSEMFYHLFLADFCTTHNGRFRLDSSARCLHVDFRSSERGLVYSREVSQMNLIMIIIYFRVIPTDLLLKAHRTLFCTRLFTDLTFIAICYFRYTNCAWADEGVPFCKTHRGKQFYYYYFPIVQQT